MSDRRRTARRPSPRRLAAAAAAALVAAIGLGAASAPASGAAFAIRDCVHAAQRPTQIVLACADGGYYLSGLRFSSWGGPVARGQGFASINDCDPYCAVGTFRRYPVRVVLSARIACRPTPPASRAGRRLYYNRLVILAGAGRPAFMPARDVVNRLTCRR